ncbi:hypothetical protein FIBSPDRAFT_953111 [Athelia psychrophila]|uniref:Uncharacterized protein n=1 Tax=Athelia psychrophila TaxID=1759441 RepID=A0A166KUY7_9AGAM|nr:hypothetical protein FIBSPDRAFT_953111 [Fibularhizoctonia sp. CBS 109695]
MPDSDDSGLGNLIDQAFKLKFKNSAKGVADISLEKRKTLERVHSSIQAALDGVIDVKKGGRAAESPHELFKKAMNLAMESSEVLGLNALLWLLLQRGKVELSKNPHFYPEIKNYSNDFCIKPWVFTQSLSKLEKLEDLQHRVTQRWESQQRQPPRSNSRNKTHVIHILMDDGDCVIFKSSHGDYYKNIGNIWKTESDVTVLKVRAIQNNITRSRLCQHVSDVRKPVDIMRIWEEQRATSIQELILHLETDPVPTAQSPVAVPVPPIQPSVEHAANPAPPTIRPTSILAHIPVASTTVPSGSESTASVPSESRCASANSAATTSTVVTSATYGNASIFSNTRSTSSATLHVTASSTSIVTTDMYLMSGTFAQNTKSLSVLMMPVPVEIRKEKKSWVRRVKDWAAGK